MCEKLTRHPRVLARADEKLTALGLRVWWDVKSLKNVTVNRSFYSHCGPIHDIQVVPNEFEMGCKTESEKPGALKRCEEEENLTKFVTCSSDRTIRFWHLIDS